MKSIENIELCEQVYKRQKLESGEAKVGEWKEISEEDLNNNEYLYFDGKGDDEYAQTMKQILNISFTSEDEEEGEDEQFESSQSVVASNLEPISIPVNRVDCPSLAHIQVDEES